MIVPPSNTLVDQGKHARIVALVLPDVKADTGADISLTGQTTERIDLADRMAEALPLLVLVVILLSTVLLLTVFRSLVVPIKAAIAILLSIASSFGVVAAVFQWGWLADPVGVDGNLPILPILMFAILFGSSMDYEVFIVSRICSSPPTDPADQVSASGGDDLDSRHEIHEHFEDSPDGRRHGQGGMVQAGI